MRAAVITGHGGPEVLEHRELPDIEARPGECLVRVEACGVEPGLDAMTRAGTGKWNLSFPHVLGAAAVGIVEQAAEGRPRQGERVAVIPGIPCRRCEACRRGQHNGCGNREIIGVHRWGGYAELVSVPPENLVPLPADGDPVAAAAMPVTYVTAWHMVTRRANVRPSDTVLVMGATGNVGYAAAQIAGLCGARVLAAGRGVDRLRSVAEAVGAEAVVDVTADDAAAQVHELTDGRGVDVVVETVGPATWATSLAAIAVEGRVVSAGGGSGTQLDIDLPAVYRRNITLAFSSQGTHQDARNMFAAFGRGRLPPRVGQVFSHDEVVRAHQALTAPDAPMGKVVIRY